MGPTGTTHPSRRAVLPGLSARGPLGQVIEANPRTPRGELCRDRNEAIGTAWREAKHHAVITFVTNRLPGNRPTAADSDRMQAAPAMGALSATATRSSAVLVVEDNSDVGALIAAALEEEQCLVRVARSGAEALRLVTWFRPELITLDIGLPDMDGFAVLDRLAGDPETAGIPIITVSARGVAREVGPRAQVKRAITKPFYLSEVVDAVLETLGRHAISP